MTPLIWDTIVAVSVVILLTVAAMWAYECYLKAHLAAHLRGKPIPVSPCAVKSHCYRLAYVMWRCDVCGEERRAERN